MKIREIFRIASELTKETGRPFTPDGHLIGSAGDFYAKHLYGLELLPVGEPVHDALHGSRRIQIKATSKDRISISSKPEHLIALRIVDGRPEEVFNGPGDKVWNSAGKQQKNGQRQITVSKLRDLMAAVPPAQRIPQLGKI